MKNPPSGVGVPSAGSPGGAGFDRGVLLFDTYSLLFRAHHALPPMNTATGFPTSALYGFSAVVLKVLREQRPARLAFAVDAPAKTFRHVRYPEYKGTRDALPSALGPQLRRLPDLLRAFCVPTFEVPGFEADDVLATLAHGLAAENCPVIVVSGDRDMLQLVTDTTRVLFVGARGREATLFDVAAVHQRFNVGPERLPSFTALVGDPSDNIPGIAGVGPRSAARLLQDFTDVADILEHLDAVSSKALRDKLTAGADQMKVNEELARLRRDTPLPEGARAAPLTAASLAELQREFEALEFRSLVPRLQALRVG